VNGGTEAPVVDPGTLTLNEVIDLHIRSKQRGNPEEIVYFEGLRARKERGEQIHRVAAVWPGHQNNGADLIDTVKILLDVGAECSEYILADEGRMQQWAIEQSCNPDIQARVHKVKDLQNLDSRINSLTCQNLRGTTVLEHGAIAGYLRDKFSTVSFNKTIYIYDKGIYRPNAGDLEERIREIITRSDAKCSITRDTRDILAYVATYNRCLEFPFNRHKDLIPVQNGIVKIDYITGTAALLPHSPEFKFTFQLPVVFNSAARYEPFHNEVLSQYVEEDVVDTLYQIPAQALLQMQGSKPYKKSYILQGDADAGKTTYLEWNTALIGPENIAHASLHQIGQDRFINAVLESKILNACDDLSDVPLQNIGPFKALTGGYDHQVERKHQQPYQSLITAVHVFTCNAPPEVPEKILFDSAFWSRFEYLHFPNVFEIDPNFKEEYFTSENISGSFNKVIETMIRIRRDGLVINHSPSEVKDEWQLSSDPFAKFCRDNMIETSDEQSFDKLHLLDAFQDYCHENEINQRKVPGTLKAMTTIVFKNGFKDAKRGKKGVRVYAAHKNWKPDSKYRPSKEGSSDAGSNKTL
jgi:phage/plasmid-associated DNA primase